MKYISVFLFLYSFPIFAVDRNIEDKELVACFYAESSVNRAPLCLPAGEYIAWLDDIDWNDQITSVTVPAGLEVTLYKNNNFNPPLKKLVTNIDQAGLREIGMENKISSLKVNTIEKVCLFEDANYQGANKCLGAGEIIEWYEDEYLHNKISSIRIPEGLQATIYRNNKYFYTIFEDMDFMQLNELQMQDNISKVTVDSSSLFPCNYLCAIRHHYILHLPQIYHAQWNDENQPYRYIGLDFIRDINENFTVTLSPQIQIKISPHTATFINKGKHFNYPLSPDTRNLSILMGYSRIDKIKRIQLMESNQMDNFYLSPIFAIWDIENFQDTKWRVDNHQSIKPLILFQALLSSIRHVDRQQRNLNTGQYLCFFIPLLATYNYLTQGKCNQFEEIDETQHSYLTANNKYLQSTLPVSVAATPTTTRSEFELQTLNSRYDIGALALYSAVRTCDVSLTHILSSRKNHDAESNDCIYWTIDIITLYTLLFGSGTDTTWNSEHFGRMIDNILRFDTTGYAMVQENLELEKQLIEAVKMQDQSLSDGGLQSKKAFNYAQLGWADYILSNDEPNRFNNIVSQQTHIDTPSPQDVQTSHMLGTYILDVAQYTPHSIAPRVFERGQWVEHSEQQFESEIVRYDSPQFSLLLTVIDQWEKTFAEHLRYMPQSSFSHAAEAIAVALQMELTSPPNPYLSDNIYFIVRLKGHSEPLSILSAQIRAGEILIRASLSAPQNIIAPYREGAIRGAGTFAVAQLVEYAKNNDIPTIVSHVISQPSAIVKKKLGFKAISE